MHLDEPSRPVGEDDDWLVRFDGRKARRMGCRSYKLQREMRISDRIYLILTPVGGANEETLERTTCDFAADRDSRQPSVSSMIGRPRQR